MESIVEVAYGASVKAVLTLLEKNLLPDVVIRLLTRLLLAGRLRSGYKPTAELQLSDLLHFVNSIKEMPIAINTEKPKTQHYELPTAFFELVLGRNMKYSSCYFPKDSSSLEEAEEAILALYCKRANVEDGQSVLDVGCGWGSLSLYVASKYSNCKLTGLCNSKTQKAFIDDQCRKLGIRNVEIIVGDISTFEHEGTYDRVFSIEMFEHMKNYGELLKKIGRWMKDDSLLFVHYFCHKTFAYHFEDVHDDDWITRYFFSGGTMPSANLLLYFQDDVSIVDHWLLNGKHYARTSEEWLKRMDKEKVAIREIMEMTYGKEEAVKWMVYWRTFFMAVAELFGYNNGEEWMISHFLFKKK
ncbi:hypothetical protein HA466_0033290 [Hirschfeldia incana]|nr:hypothetical protein HA466_0033290 [Hirschfeldia incana]